MLDRLSFQRFLGLRRSSQVPDRTTFWTFRERLTTGKTGDALFEAVNRQLAQHGYIARGGQKGWMPVWFPRQHVTEKERALLKEQAMPMEWKPAQRRQKDTRPPGPEARILFRLQGLGRRRPALPVIRRVRLAPPRRTTPTPGGCPGSREHRS